jgi:hypothetical protein
MNFFINHKINVHPFIYAWLLFWFGALSGYYIYQICTAVSQGVIINRHDVNLYESSDPFGFWLHITGNAALAAGCLIFIASLKVKKPVKEVE